MLTKAKTLRLKGSESLDPRRYFPPDLVSSDPTTLLNVRIPVFKDRRVQVETLERVSFNNVQTMSKDNIIT